jgi:hypothetical protein
MLSDSMAQNGIILSLKRLLLLLIHLPNQATFGLFEEVIDEIFVPLCNLLPSTTYVVDGLDECEPKETQKILQTFQKMVSQHGTRIFISGREALDVTNSVSNSTAIVISDEDNREDICRFIEWKIGEKMRERRLTEKESVLEDIKNKLNEKADRMSVQHLLLSTAK